MAGVLDTDVGALVPLAREFLGWWGSELAEMARPLLRERGLRGAPLVAVRTAAGGYALVRDGESAGEASIRRPVRAALALPSQDALVRRVPAPGLSERDWRRILANDVDRLTPFEAAEVYLALRFETGDDGVRRAELAVVRRGAAEFAIQEAGAAGVSPNAVLVEGTDGQPLDLLPAMRAAGALGARRNGAGGWWWAVAILAALNIAAAVWGDVRDTARLQALVDQQQPVVERLQHLRAQVTREAERRRALLAARTAASPLRGLNAVTVALPDGAWVQRLSLEQGAVRLTGYHHAGIDVSAALQASPVFANVRTASSDLTASAPGATAGEPFDLSADIRPAPLQASH